MNDNQHAFLAAQATEPQRNLNIWLGYVTKLSWRQGSLDQCCYNAALRAASLGINEDLVLDVLSERVAGQVMFLVLPRSRAKFNAPGIM